VYLTSNIERQIHKDSLGQQIASMISTTTHTAAMMLKAVDDAAMKIDGSPTSYGD